MERKYTCYFMNGRVIFVKNKDIDEAIDIGKELLVIDTHSGTTLVIGADKEVNDNPEIDSEYIYNMYTKDYNGTDELVSNLSCFNKILFTQGERIYMKSGKEATDYFNGHFAEYGNYKPNDLDCGCVEIPQNDPCKCVDMERTINYFENRVKDGKEKLECMSCCYVKGLNWDNTKYKKF